MSKLIAVSGAQSSGKSTLLKALQNEGFIVDSFKASRTVMKNMKTSIKDFTENENKTMAFQNALLSSKYDRDRYLSCDSGGDVNGPLEFILTERTPIDLYTYADHWYYNGDFSPAYKNWLQGYWDGCLEAYAKCYNAVVYLPSGKFEHEDDGIRADAESQDGIDKLMKYLYSKYTQIPCFVLQSTDINDRVEDVKNIIKDLKNDRI